MPDRRADANQIFISYRREDTAGVTGRIYDRLTREYGRGAVFKDVDSVPLGVNFRTYLDSVIARCSVMLVVIGERWAERLADPRDFVRVEIESALRRDIPIIPLLVHGTSFPSEESLPESLRALADRNGTCIGHDPHFHADLSRLIGDLEVILRAGPAGWQTPAADRNAAQPRAILVAGAGVTPRASSPRRVLAEPAPLARAAAPLSTHGVAPGRPRVEKREGGWAVNLSALVAGGALWFTVLLVADTVIEAHLESLVESMTDLTDEDVITSLLFIMIEGVILFVLGLAGWARGWLRPRTRWTTGLWLSALPACLQLAGLIYLIAETSSPYDVDEVARFICLPVTAALLPVFAGGGLRLGRLYAGYRAAGKAAPRPAG